MNLSLTRILAALSVGGARITGAPSGYGVGRPDSCCFLIQDTLSGAYWPREHLQNVRGTQILMIVRQYYGYNLCPRYVYHFHHIGDQIC